MGTAEQQHAAEIARMDDPQLFGRLHQVRADLERQQRNPELSAEMRLLRAEFDRRARAAWSQS